MSAYSVLIAFERGYIPSDAESLMPEISEIDSRLPALIETAFDAELYRRAISIPKSHEIDTWLLVVYQSHLLYLDRYGPQPVQVYRDITEWFAEVIRRVHNATRGYSFRSKFRRTPTDITQAIVQTITNNANNALEIIKQQIAEQAEVLRKRIAVRKISDIFRNWKAEREQRAATTLQTAFRGLIGRRIAARLKLREKGAATTLQAAIRGWKVRLELRKLQHNMTLVTA